MKQSVLIKQRKAIFDVLPRFYQVRNLHIKNNK